MTPPFRFAVNVAKAETGAAWRATARRAEELGYDALLIVDHLGRQLAPVPALAAAADATTRLRVGSFVFSNDYRNPVMLAKELATLDVLSGGRLEIGLGAGWMTSDYAKLGIRYDPPAVRVERLFEATLLMQRLLTEDEVDHRGKHYTVKVALWPRPVQRPRPPFMIGGGGPRIQAFAARNAEIVALSPQVDERGRPKLATLAAGAVERRVARIRELAGERAASLELNAIVFDAAVANDESGIAARLEAFFKGTAASAIRTLAGGGPDESPFFLYGSRGAIVRRLRAQRERLGISYVAIPGAAMEDFAPVVKELAGT